MAKILIVGQKELVANPVFKQDKNMLEVYNILKDKNEVKILFLHKNIKLNETDDNSVDRQKIDEQKNAEDTKFDVQQFCIRDMIKSNSLKKNLNEFVKKHNIETIIFMSNHMAKLIMPYIESLLESLNIICDFRLSNISYFLQQYKYEKEKEEPNFNAFYKDFRIHFVQMLSILKNTDYIILDKDYDVFLLEKQGIDNIVYIENIENCLLKNVKNKRENKEYNIVNITINRDNYASNNATYIQKCENDNQYIINETKNFNLIKDINNVIKNSKADYFCIHINKIKFLPKTLGLLTEYLSFNRDHALASPIILNSREQMFLKTQFDSQRFNNFSNWEEGKPLLFSDCVVIKKKFFNKVGLFDTRFKTFDYALFDFILRIYQIKAYYCIMKDVSVFKPINVARQLSLFKQDRNVLCNKWGESIFNMGI